MGLATVGVLSSNGSIMIVNPLVYVLTNVAKCVTLKKEKFNNRKILITNSKFNQS